MLRAELAELHYIVPQRNLPSIRQHGILGHEAVKQIGHASVAMQEIQDMRTKIRVPHGLPLHEYANVYFHARNPMMFKRREHHAQLAVLRVSTDVLDMNGVVITDRNASSNYCRFLPSPAGLAFVDRELTFAENWKDPDQITEWKKKSAKCAEVLVPKFIPADKVTGVYVSCQTSQQSVETMGLGWPVAIDVHLFFRG